MKTQYRNLSIIFALFAIIELDAFYTQNKTWCIFMAIAFAAFAEYLHGLSKRKSSLGEA